MTTDSKANNKLAKQILWAMFLGIIVGIILNKIPSNAFIEDYIINGVLHILGKAFIAIITMLVVPIVFVSLVCGTTHLSNLKTFGRLAGKTVSLYLFTTVFAVTIGLVFASFIIPLGATVNMDGTAIMQGIATVFIANAYQIHLSLTAYLMVVVTATLASIGAAGVPSAGLITLKLVLKQVGLPVEGIAMIIGIDRLLDMVRTAVNISGDATVACICAKSKKALDED